MTQEQVLPTFKTFPELEDVLKDIVSSRRRNELKELSRKTFADSIALDGLLKARISCNYYDTISSLEVATRDTDNIPWNRYNLNLGQPTNINGTDLWQLILPSEQSRPRESINVASFTEIPRDIQQTFMRGLGLFTLRNA